LNEKIDNISSAKDSEIEKISSDLNAALKDRDEKEGVIGDLKAEIVSLNEKVNEIYAIKDSEIDSLNGLLKERDEEITALNEKVDIINDVVQIVEDNDKIIGALGDDISQFEADLADKTDQNSLLMDENTFLRNNLNEKINQIGYLNEEIQVLKDIIEEKDKTIDFLKGDE
jgi:chromosome segregation ATPase